MIHIPCGGDRTPIDAIEATAPAGDCRLMSMPARPMPDVRSIVIDCIPRTRHGSTGKPAPGA